jgi:diguanylate cyclase (GGDEF)-like protein/PAS domain S-box-containing protein
MVEALLASTFAQRQFTFEMYLLFGHMCTLVQLPFLETCRILLRGDWMTDVRKLLLIDDDAAHAELFREALLNAGDGPFEGEWVRTLAEGIERLGKKGVWAIFLNMHLPDSQGLDTVDKLLQALSGVPTLVLGGVRDQAIAKEALRRGAKDYLLEDHIDSYSFDRAIRNMVERQTAEEVLFTEKERAQVTLNSIGDAVLSTDMLGNVTYLNAVAEKMTGWLKEDALGRPLAKVFEIVDGSTRQPSPNPMELALKKNETVGLTANCILIRRDGCEAAIEDSAAPIHDRSGLVTGAVIVFHDVSMSRAMTLEMAHLAQHDILTDLPNRLLLKDRLTQAIAQARRNNTKVAVLFLDLDQFKHINDSLGHAIGDNLLQSVAARLISCVRSSDTVSRQGGDEFVVLLSEIKHAADAGITARKILTALTASHIIDQQKLHITASIGLSTYPDDGEDADILIKHADTAMYQAKKRDRNNYQFFKEDMNLRAVKRQSVEGGLRDALESGQFVLHYQPKVNLTTGAICGAEALLRWRHPALGLILPLEFLPTAEDCGLILPIGRWVLMETCSQVQDWIAAGLRVPPVAVNVSSLQFRSEGFIENLRAILNETGLAPHHLELELTETVLMQHAESSASVLHALKSVGVRLALDDFGTGYSSLSYLKRFPIDSLKIDQSFVRDIGPPDDNSPIVRAVITMAKSLNQRVVGEGVETEKQMIFLKAHGCDEAQGYYFSTPLVAGDFAMLLEKGMKSFIPKSAFGDWAYNLVVSRILWKS